MRIFQMVCVSPLLIISTALLLLVPPIHGWGKDGHATVCTIAQSRLSKASADAVKQLIPEGELNDVCLWADRVKFRYHWSSALHYIDVPDSSCTFQYKRDCKDEDGLEDRCVAGAINNYTSQLLTYGGNYTAKLSQYNLTEALLFLSHFVGDIHQPLHVGHTSDRGGNEIGVHWYRRKTELHHVWDASIIETEEEDFYDNELEGLIDAIQQNITTVWADQVKSSWEACSSKNPSCPNTYASESIMAACDWAYKGVTNDSVLQDDYFLPRRSIVNLRLAQGGVRLAAILNRIFG